MKQQIPFWPQPDPQGDAPANIYTPDSLAVLFVQHLASLMRRPPLAVLDPHVGGGAFVRAVRQVWPKCRVYVSDADPNAAGIELGDVQLGVGKDLLEVVLTEYANAPQIELCLGNPPFDRRKDDQSPLSTAGPQFDALSLHCPWMDIAWLMPIDLYSVQQWAARFRHRPVRYQLPVTRRVWPNVRGCGMWVCPGSSSLLRDEDAFAFAQILPIDWDGRDGQRSTSARTGRVSRGE